MKEINESKPGHEHCWHALRGPIHMVIKDGHTVQTCCKCDAIRQVHADHVADHARGSLGQHVKW